VEFSAKKIGSYISSSLFMSGHLVHIIQNLSLFFYIMAFFLTITLMLRIPAKLSLPCLLIIVVKILMVNKLLQALQHMPSQAK
jgi:hypothetical protein